MMKLTVFLLSAAAIVSTPAFAVNYLDQQQNNAYANMANFNQTDLAQSFTTANSNVSGGGVFTINFSTPYNVRLGLWTELPNAPSAVRLATGVAAVTGDGWADVFWNPVSVSANTTYFLTFDSRTSAGSVAGDTSNPYAGGNVFANRGYDSFGSFDYTFRTYSSDASAGAVPEPATWALMLVGFGGVGYALRRNRKIGMNLA